MKSYNKKRQIRTAAVLLALLVVPVMVLGACGMAVRSSDTTLTIDETGRIREDIVEDQGTDSFTEEELTAYVEKEIELYNSSEENAVKLNSCSVQNGDVKISLEYVSGDDYAAFNQVTFFVGTLQEAEDAGYEVERTWLDTTGAAGDMEIIRERFKEWKVCIVSEPINIKVPDKILYASDNVRVTGRLSAVVQTVMNDTDAETGSASEQTVKAKTTVHPLATVADRFAYIIYK